MKFIATVIGMDGGLYEEEVVLAPHETDRYVDDGILNNLIAEHVSRNPFYGALQDFREVPSCAPNVAVILSRDGEQTFARVSAYYVRTCADDPATAENLKRRIHRALQRWLMSTSEGTVAWLETRKTFHIGDLSEHLGNVELDGILECYGVRNLEIEMLDAGCSSWSLGDVLGAPDA